MRGTLPQVLRDRLGREGYVGIDASGILTGDRFATPAQIAAVLDDRIELNVTDDELIKR